MKRDWYFIRSMALVGLIAIGGAMACLNVGCATHARLVAPASDPVAEVLAHRDARAVAHDYPDFFRTALNKIADLKHDLTLEENK